MKETFLNIESDQSRDDASLEHAPKNLDEIDAQLRDRAAVDHMVAQSAEDERHRLQMEQGLSEQTQIARNREEEKGMEMSVPYEVEIARKKAEMEVWHAEANEENIVWTETQAAHQEANDEDILRTEQQIYDQEYATTLRGKKFYDQDPKRIHRQEEVVAWAKEYNPAGLEEEEATLERMKAIFPSRDADATKFVERYWGAGKSEHDKAEKEFSHDIQNAGSTEDLIGILSSWGGVPEADGKFLTYTRIRQSVESILAEPDQKKRIGRLNAMTKNREITEKLEQLKESDKKNFGTNLDRLDDEKAHVDEAISTVNSKFFQFSPFLFGIFSSKNRKKLATLKELGVSYDNEIERRSAVPIALGLRLQHLRSETKKIRDVSAERGMSTTLPVKFGTTESVNLIALDHKLMRVPTPRAFPEGSIPRKLGFFSRIFSHFS